MACACKWPPPPVPYFAWTNAKLLAAQGREVGKKIGAFMYVECSAKTNEGVFEVFKIAARLALHAPLKFSRRKRRYHCTAL